MPLRPRDGLPHTRPRTVEAVCPGDDVKKYVVEDAIRLLVNAAEGAGVLL